jgi:hypothetical protein
MFCSLRLVFGGTDGVGSLFHVLHSRTRFRRYRGASGPIFLFCAPKLVFGGTEGVPSRYDVFRSRTCFRRYRGRQVPFSCFAPPDSFSAVPGASGLIFMFCAPGLVFGGSEGVRSRFLVLRSRTHFLRYRGRRVCFHVLRSQTRFRRFRGHRVPFSCFARSDSFSAVPRALGPAFVFCAPGLVFDGTEGVPSHFNVFRSRTCFRR